MPRLTITHAEAQQAAVLRALDVYIGERRRAGANHQNIAKSLGLGYSTLRAKMLKPGSFRLDELQQMANTMNISISKLLGETDSQPR